MKIDQVQHRASRYYCGLPKTCLTIALDCEIGWIPGVMQRDLETLRLYNQIVLMSSDRLTQKIYENEKRIKGAWYRNLYGICDSINAQELLSRNHVIHCLKAIKKY